jgi:hypothetical protein
MTVLEGELWDDEAIAEYLGIQVQSVPMWLKRHGLKRSLVVDANDVIAARMSQPGQGARTDLRK